MATENHYFTGECRWARVQEVDNFGKYSLQVKLEGKDLEDFVALGLKNQPKDGWVTLRRDPEGMIWKDRVQQKAGPPKVIDKDGIPFTGLIGNGSQVQVKLTTYTYDNKFGKGRGSRLDGVCVLNLVKYEAAQPDGSPVPKDGDSRRHRIF